MLWTCLVLFLFRFQLSFCIMELTIEWMEGDWFIIATMALWVSEKWFFFSFWPFHWWAAIFCIFDPLFLVFSIGSWVVSIKMHKLQHKWLFFLGFVAFWCLTTRKPFDQIFFLSVILFLGSVASRNITLVSQSSLTVKSCFAQFFSDSVVATHGFAYCLRKWQVQLIL